MESQINFKMIYLSSGTTLSPPNLSAIVFDLLLKPLNIFCIAKLNLGWRSIRQNECLVRITSDNCCIKAFTSLSAGITVIWFPIDFNIQTRAYRNVGLLKNARNLRILLLNGRHLSFSTPGLTQRNSLNDCCNSAASLQFNRLNDDIENIYRARFGIAWQLIIYLESWKLYSDFKNGWTILLFPLIANATFRANSST